MSGVRAARRVLVVGGGLAGTAAALACADAGADVVLVEARARLGGLAHSFRRGELSIDNGQHVFLRCCTAYRGLLERLGTAGDVVLQRRLDIPVLRPGARASRLRRSALPAPAHLAAALATYAPLSPRERVGAARAALALRRVDAEDAATDARSFASWLVEHDQSSAARAALWDLVGVATLNATAEQASLAAAAGVFQQGLLRSAGAADIGWSRVPLSALHGDAAERALGAAGARVLRSTRVEHLRGDAGGWRAAVRGAHRSAAPGEDVLDADAVVLAVPPAAARDLLPPGAVDLADGWVERLGRAPIVGVHVLFDAPVLDAPFAAGVGTPVQWVFDRTASSGADRAVPGGQHLVVSLSAAQDLVGAPAAAVLDHVVPALRALLPRAAGARVVEAFVTREPEATFLPGPGTAADRPGQATRAPGLAVAGAWTATGWPATMEGAVRSGDAAARAVLEHLGHRPDRRDGGRGDGQDDVEDGREAEEVAA